MTPAATQSAASHGAASRDSPVWAMMIWLISMPPLGPFDEVGVTDPPPVVAGEPQVGGEHVEVVEQAGHGAG